MLDGKWEPRGGVALDELGRPAIWHDGRSTLRGAETNGEKEERRRRVESYLKNSNMSLVNSNTQGAKISDVGKVAVTADFKVQETQCNMFWKHGA